MSAVFVSAAVFASVFGGAICGMALRKVLPEHHRNQESRNVVKLGMGLIATMSALLLGLLVASAKEPYDTQKSELTQLAASVSFLDRVLANYGPEPNRVWVRLDFTDHARTPGDRLAHAQVMTRS